MLMWRLLTLKALAKAYRLFAGPAMSAYARYEEARCLWRGGDGEGARKRFAALRFVLQEEADGAEKVIRALDYLHKRHPKSARVEYWAARVHPGRIMFEIDGVPDDVAREALRLGAAKLPVKTRIVTRIDVAVAEHA